MIEYSMTRWPHCFVCNYITSLSSLCKHIWKYCIMTSSNGNIFRVTGPLCGVFTGPGEFPTQGPVTRSFDVFFHLCLNKRLNKQPWCWWFETLPWSLWRHSNGTSKMIVRYILPSVCVRLSQFSQLSVMQYMGLCVFSLLMSLTTIVRIRVLRLIIIKSEVLPFAIV